MNSKGLLIIILLGALVVRLWGINWGLPYNYFVDEGYLVYWAFFSGSHYLRPPYYLYAPLVPMILLVEFSVYFIGGFVMGIFSSPSQFFSMYVSDPTIIFQMGRITMVLFGVATVWLVFIIGKTFFNTKIGLLGSFFLAFAFLHVKESQYIKQDVIMSFFIIATFYFLFRIVQKGTLRDYFFCGITCALAFGAKYQAILLLPIMFLTLIISQKKIISQKMFILCCTFFIAFSIIHPYFILEPISTIQQTLQLAADSKVIYPEHLQGKPVWWWFLFEHIPQGIGFPLFIASFAGFAIAVFRAKAKINYLFVTLLPILFLVTIDVFTKMHFARYAVITLPFFALGGAIFLDYIGQKIKDERKKNAIIIVLTFVLVFPSLLRIVQFDSLLSKPDTRTLAKKWFEQIAPRGSKVFVESMVKPEHAANVNIVLNLDEHIINQRINQAKQRGLDALFLKSLRDANKNKIGYDIITATQVDQRRDLFTDVETQIQSVSYYYDRGVTYLVLTSWVHNKLSAEFTKSLFHHYKLIKEFRPTYDFKDDPHLVKMDYEMLDRVDIFRRGVVFGPVISIYKLKKAL